MTIRKILILFMVLMTTTALWASNTITYTATSQLSGYNGSLDIGAATFGPAITSHTFSNGTGIITCSGEITTIGDYAFAYCDGLTSVTIPNSVTTIGESAFAYCDGLTSVTIPNSVTTIGDYAFAYCDGLTSVTIPNSVTTIGKSAFENCSGLASVTIPNSVTTIGYGAFRECKGLTSITIPNSVTMLNGCAFAFCSGLTTITIPNSVTRIAAGVFMGCKGLTSVTIPNSVTEIGSAAFESCSGLTSIIIPNSVTSIGSMAFEYCRGLASVTIPNSVTTIEYDAFSFCSSLTDIRVSWTETEKVPSLIQVVFQEVPFPQATLHVPFAMTVLYRYRNGWIDFNNIVEPYTRENLYNGKFGTVCLGSSVYSLDGVAAKFYELNYYNASENALYLNEVTSLEAGVPYIFEATDESFTMEFYTKFDKKLVTPAAAQTVNGLVGTLTDIEIPSNGKKGAIQDNEVRIAADGNKVIVAANRAYIDLDAVPTSPQGGNAPVRRIGVSYEQTTDLESNVENQNSEVNNKYILNGHLMIMRDGKMYNVQGYQF